MPLAVVADLSNPTKHPNVADWVDDDEANTLLDQLLNRAGPVSLGRDSGEWMTTCPAHQRKDVWLRIDAPGGGGFYLWCKNGCTCDAILGSLGLRRGEPRPPRAARAPAPVPDCWFEYGEDYYEEAEDPDFVYPFDTAFTDWATPEG